MQGQLAAVYYQAYKLAYDMAKRAEKAFQYERGDITQTFITFGHWDGLRRGLLAGERLAHDLRRMDAAYVAQNKRELEIVKMVSLAQHDPNQLARLRVDGVADISLTEDDYDRDFPDHYLRRFKSVAVTVPCAPGPYHGVYGTLDLLRGATRPTSSSAEMRESAGAVQSIVTSQALQDPGVFELLFRDDRLLPFEGIGAHLNLASSGPQFTFRLSAGTELLLDSIDDLVLDVRYTARKGRTADLPSGTRTLKRLIRVRDDFADAWATFKEGTSDEFALVLTASSWRRGRNETLSSVTDMSVHAWWSESVTVPALTLAPPSGSADPGSPTTADLYSKWTGDVTYTFPDPVETGEWTLAFTTPSTEARAALRELWLVLTYVVDID